MAITDFDFFKYNSGDNETGAAKAHSDFSTDVLSSGGDYCRDFYVNTGFAKCLIKDGTISLDGAKAISIRAAVRTSAVLHNQVYLIAKTNAANPTAIASPGTTPGYKFGLKSPSASTSLFGNFQAHNGTTDYNNSSTGITVSGMSTTSNFNNKWTHLRMDVIPVSTDGNLSGDNIKLYTSADAGSSWTLREEITINSDANGFIPWNDQTYNRCGFMLYNAYIDNFQVYLSA